MKDLHLVATSGPFDPQKLVVEGFTLKDWNLKSTSDFDQWRRCEFAHVRLGSFVVYVNLQYGATSSMDSVIAVSWPIQRGVGSNVVQGPYILTPERGAQVIHLEDDKLNEALMRSILPHMPDQVPEVTDALGRW